MNIRIVLAGLVIALLPTTALAAPVKAAPQAAKAAPQAAKTAAVYECSKCHMHYTAAQAKKDHYKDPMDGGILIPVKTTKK